MEFRWKRTGIKLSGLLFTFLVAILCTLSVAEALTITQIQNQTVNVNETLTLTVTATGSGENIRFNRGGFPTGANFTPVNQQGNSRSGTFSWTPVTMGTISGITITALQGSGNNPPSATTTFSITVLPGNRPPELSLIGNKTVTEAETLSFTITATDPDGDPLIFSASNLPTGATFDPTTKVFTWTPGYNQSGSYPNVLFTVTDTGSLSDQESITISVGNVNRPPVLNPIGSQTVNEGETLTVTISGSDPDMGDSLVYSATELPKGATFDATTQTLTWAPDYDQAGNYAVLFKVTDNGIPPLSSSEGVSITVGNINRPPVLNPTGNQTINEGNTLTFTLSGSDPDGDTLMFSASNLPAGATFDPAGRVFTWTPSYEQAGNYLNILFTVSDRSLSAQEAITITVGNTNRPPVLDPIGSISNALKGETLTFKVTGSDPDGYIGPYGNSLRFSAKNLPEGATFDESSQTFTWTPIYPQLGEYRITFSVTDDGDPQLGDSEEMSITVVNRPPVAVAGPNATVEQTGPSGASYTLNGEGSSDPDGDLLNYSWTGPFGTVTGPTPTVSLPAGANSITLQVSDGTDTAIATVTITVRDTIPPVVKCTVPDQGMWYKSDVTLTCNASDGGSGLASPEDASFTLTASLASAAETASAATPSKTISDKAGNSVSVGPYSFKIDKKAPTVTCPAGDSVWHATDQSVYCTVTDGGSGVNNSTITLSTNVSTGTETSNASTDSQQACDKVGNCATAGPVSGFQIDKKGPSVTLIPGGISDGATYYFGFVPSAPGCSAVDGGSGVAGQCEIIGYGTTAGTYTIKATAKDVVGNPGEAAITLTYTVLRWTLNGFYQPVDMNGVYNGVKNGSTVPLKFKIFAGSTELTEVARIQSLTYAQTSCDGNAITDDLETTATGGTALRYDATAGQFVYNWKTPTSAGKCYRVTMTAQDGSALAAFFRLK